MLERFEILQAELLDLGLPALHLRGPGPGREAGHELLELLDPLLLLRVLRLDAVPHLALLPHHAVVAAGVGDDGLVVDVGDVRADGVQEVPVVADGDEHPVVLVEEGLQPADRVEVEVVGGLVEQESLGGAEEGLGEQDAQLEAAGQALHGLLVPPGADAQPLEQLRGLGLGLVAVLLGDGPLELGQLVPVLLRHVGLGQDVVLLLHGLPEDRVAHEDHVDDPVGLVAEVVLAEDADLLRPVDAAGVRLLVAGEDLHEGGLAGAVRAGESVAAPRRERDVHVLEELLGPEGLGDVLDRDHGGRQSTPSARFSRGVRPSPPGCAPGSASAYEPGKMGKVREALSGAWSRRSSSSSSRG